MKVAQWIHVLGKASSKSVRIDGADRLILVDIAKHLIAEKKADHYDGDITDLLQQTRHLFGREPSRVNGFLHTLRRFGRVKSYTQIDLNFPGPARQVGDPDPVDDLIGRIGLFKTFRYDGTDHTDVMVSETMRDFQRTLPHRIETGEFTEGHFETLMDYLIGEKSKDYQRSNAEKFFKEVDAIPILYLYGFFEERDVTIVMHGMLNRLLLGDLVTVTFLTQHLPVLLKLGLFNQRHMKMLVRALKGKNNVDRLQAIAFLAGYPNSDVKKTSFSYLLEAGLIDKNFMRAVADTLVHDPDYYFSTSSSDPYHDVDETKAAQARRGDIGPSIYLHNTINIFYVELPRLIENHLFTERAYRQLVHNLDLISSRESEIDRFQDSRRIPQSYDEIPVHAQNPQPYRADPQAGARCPPYQQ